MEPTLFLNNSFLYNNQLSYVVRNFSDLCNLLEVNSPVEAHTVESTKATLKAVLVYKSQNSLPKTIQYHSGSTQLVQGLMFRAIQHWCCISFKIVPIELELLRSNTPKTILYCVAAISLATINTQQLTPEITITNRRNKNIKSLSAQAMDGFKKDVAFHLYKTACNYLNDIMFEEDEEDSISTTAIQCYFCLSYTSNLLRLPGEQRVWHYLACDLMKNKVKYIHESPQLRQCWYRWYYIDAWIAIALNQECLLPDRLPFFINKPATTVSPKQDNSTPCCSISNDNLYEFAIMTQYIRRYNRAIQAGTLPCLYDMITLETELWWQTVARPNLHLRICYYSMRLVVVFSLLQHADVYPITSDLLLEGLSQSLEVLQGIQNLKLLKCDQSTYHHMFFAVHQTLKRILSFVRKDREFQELEIFVKQQFEMNLFVLEATDAFRDDIYQMREIGAKIESDLFELGFVDDVAAKSKRSMSVFRACITPMKYKKAKV